MSGAFWSGTLSSSYIRSDGETVPTQVWYPTNDAQGETARYGGLLEGESWVDAAPACDILRPIVVFSHGNGGVGWQTAFHMHFLASHGFVVVAMDHLRNTFRDDDRSLRSSHVLQRPMDVRSTFDWLVAWSADPGSPLYGCVDSAGGYAVMGHSFGGYTAFMVAGATLGSDALLRLCEDGEETACEVLERWGNISTERTIDRSDTRVWAAVTLSPWDADGLLSEGMADVRVPSLTLTGTDDVLTPVEQVSASFAGPPGPIMRIW